MAIISAFFATRTLARNAKANLGGKVIDNGSDAAQGQRWELQYGTENAVDVLASIIEAESADAGISPVETPLQLARTPRKASASTSAREYTLQDRKKNPVQVKVRRSKSTALLAALLANS